jgi:hypothetical protein
MFHHHDEPERTSSTEKVLSFDTPYVQKPECLIGKKNKCQLFRATEIIASVGVARKISKRKQEGHPFCPVRHRESKFRSREHRGEIPSHRVASTVSEEISGSSCPLSADFIEPLQILVTNDIRWGCFGSVLVPLNTSVLF